jgi:hypothetical protein
MAPTLRAICAGERLIEPLKVGGKATRHSTQ